MSQQFQLIARPRLRTGTNPVRRLRREGDVPAIIYGGDKDNASIAIDHNTLFHNLENEAFHYAIIEINTDGNKEQVVLRDIQSHPFKPVIMHVDFMRVSDKQTLTMSVPIHFTSEEECPGVSEGGVISHLINEVEIICLPKDLPEALLLDVANLELNEALHLSDIKMPEGVSMTSMMHEDSDENDYPVVSVAMPKVIVEPVDEDELDDIDLDDEDATADGDEDSDGVEDPDKEES